jgi:hypothetical protein
LRVARFGDYEQIASLEQAHGLSAAPMADWQGYWTQNPLWPQVKDHWPIGWVLEDRDGKIVGSLCNIPSLYHLQGRELICANGRGWVVDEAYRGVALWLFAEYFAQERCDLFINTTVNALSARSFSSLSTRVPVGDWQSAAYFITHYRGFARAVLEREGVPFPGAMAHLAAASLRARDSFKASPSVGVFRGEVRSIDHFDARFDTFWQELLLRKAQMLLASRDRRTLQWHFKLQLASRRLWILAAEQNGLLRGYCIFKRQDAPNNLRRMRLVDFQSIEPDVNILNAIVDAALAKCHREGMHLLELVGLGMPDMAAFEHRAPWKRTLPSWLFYYKSNDPVLEVELREPRVWNPSLYDGDASLD